MNGQSILSREVAGDIKALEDSVPPPKCDFSRVVKPAVIRSLRVAEHACLRAYRLELMLWVVLFVLAVKPGNFTVWDIFAMIAKSMIGGTP